MDTVIEIGKMGTGKVIDTNLPSLFNCRQQKIPDQDQDSQAVSLQEKLTEENLEESSSLRHCLFHRLVCKWQNIGTPL